MISYNAWICDSQAGLARITMSCDLNFSTLIYTKISYFQLLVFISSVNSVNDSSSEQSFLWIIISPFSSLLWVCYIIGIDDLLFLVFCEINYCSSEVAISFFCSFSFEERTRCMFTIFIFWGFLGNLSCVLFFIHFFLLDFLD